MRLHRIHEPEGGVRHSVRAEMGCDEGGGQGTDALPPQVHGQDPRPFFGSFPSL